MSATIISRFKEKPRTRTARWAMGLGLGSILVGPALGINAAVIRPALERVLGGELAVALVSGLAAAFFLLPAVALIVSVKAFRKGERSWAVWFGLVPSALGVASLVFMIIGEFVFPH